MFLKFIKLWRMYITMIKYKGHKQKSKINKNENKNQKKIWTLRRNKKNRDKTKK